MALKLIHNYNLIQTEDWNKYIINHPNVNFFQSPEFISFISQISIYTPVCLIAVDELNHICGVLCGVIQKDTNKVKSFFSSRLIIWGGPVVNNNNVADFLIKRIVYIYSKKCIYIEFRNLFDVSISEDIFKAHNFIFKETINYLVKLDDDNLVKKRISESKLRQIKQSIKNGAVFTEAQTEQEIIDFYNILRQLYKTKVKKPLPPQDFFIKFYQNKNLGKIFIVKRNDVILGGIVCPIFDKTIFEWYICGLDNQIKGIYPSVLATYAPIEYGLKNNLLIFDFMGAGTPQKDYGVREFKIKFGGKMVEYGRYLLITKPFIYKIGKLGLKILSKLK